MNLASALPTKAVYWAPNGQDRFGKRVFVAPVSIDVRWQDKQEEFVDQEGRVQRSRSIIYSTTSIIDGGYLYKGALTGLTAGQKAAPENLVGARLIGSVQESSSLDGADVLYKAMMA
jgi:hypothetical protein